MYIYMSAYALRENTPNYGFIDQRSIFSAALYLIILVFGAHPVLVHFRYVLGESKQLYRSLEYRSTASQLLIYESLAYFSFFLSPVRGHKQFSEVLRQVRTESIENARCNREFREVNDTIICTVDEFGYPCSVSAPFYLTLKF